MKSDISQKKKMRKTWHFYLFEDARGCRVRFDFLIKNLPTILFELYGFKVCFAILDTIWIWWISTFHSPKQQWKIFWKVYYKFTLKTYPSSHPLSSPRPSLRKKTFQPKNLFLFEQQIGGEKKFISSKNDFDKMVLFFVFHFTTFFPFFFHLVFTLLLIDPIIRKKIIPFSYNILMKM